MHIHATFVCVLEAAVGTHEHFSEIRTIMSLPPQPSPVPRVKAQTSVQLQVPSLVSQHVSCHQVTTRASPVASDNTPPSLESRTKKKRTPSPRMPKPMHAHTKLERHAATNDTALTNDRRNKLDNNAMPVRAPHTHIPSRAMHSPLGASAGQRSASLLYPGLRCQTDLHCAPEPVRRQPDLRRQHAA